VHFCFHVSLGFPFHRRTPALRSGSGNGNGNGSTPSRHSFVRLLLLIRFCRDL
jgi:hypothetical protein